MSIEEFLPSELLRPFIKVFKIIESDDGQINRVLPDTSFAMVLCTRGQISYLNNDLKTALPTAVLSGLQKSARLIHYAPKTSAIIVIFSTAGLSAFFSQSLYHLSNKSISLDNFFPHSDIIILEERLAEAVDNRSKIYIIEKFFYSKINAGRLDLLVAEAINRIQVNAGLIRIKALSDSLFISQDAFEKRFRKVTGTSPKQFASIVKMKNVIQQQAEASSLLDLSLNNGFYDQAHFNKDFKLFTGLTPGSFLKSGFYW